MQEKHLSCYLTKFCFLMLGHQQEVGQGGNLGQVHRFRVPHSITNLQDFYSYTTKIPPTNYLHINCWFVLYRKSKTLFESFC